MTSKLKRLALALASATLFGVMLTGCSGGGGGGTSTPKPTPTPGATVTPSDGITDYTVDAETKTIMANDGSWTIEVTEDTYGNNVITKSNVVSLEDMGGQSYAVVSDEVTENEAGIITVVRTLAVPRSALDSGNEAVNALLMMALDDEDVVYATFTFRYNANGGLLSVTVEYEGYTVQYKGDGVGGLVLSDVDEELAGLYGAILGEVADEENVKELILKLAEEALAAGKDCIKITQKEFGQNTDKNIIASGECGATLDWTLDSDGVLKIKGEGRMDDTVSYLSWKSNAQDIKKVVIEEGVTSIASMAFRECDNLKEIFISSSVIEIGERAFAYENYNLENIYVDEKNQYFVDEDGVLFDLNRTTLVYYPAGKKDEVYVIPNTVTKIEAFAFFECSHLVNVIIPEGVEEIEGYTFAKCGMLKRITLPQSIMNIENWSFSECTNLKDAYYLGTEEDWHRITIGTEMNWLTSATIHCMGTGEDVIAAKVYGICGDKLEWKIYTDGVLKISGYGEMEDYTSTNAPWYNNRKSITTIIIEDGVTKIGEYAFSGCINLNNITIPNSVVYIGNKAFSECRKLTTAGPIGSGCSYEFGWRDSIPDNAFNECGNLISVILPREILSIGNNAFYDCKRLTNIALPEGLQSLGEQAFYGCETIESIKIPESVTSIGDRAFEYCIEMKSIELPKTIENWGNQVLANCRELVRVILPTNITKIEANAFKGCSGLVNVVLPDGVTDIGVNAFFNCTNLEYIELPDSIVNIGDGAFSYCTALKEITIPEEVTSIASAFTECTSLEKIRIPASVVSMTTPFDGCDSIRSAGPIGGYDYEFGWTSEIPKEAFYGLENVQEIIIPNGVTVIGEQAFYNCKNLTSITIPEDVTEIRSFAFLGCDSLAEIYYGGSEEQWAQILSKMIQSDKDKIASVGNIHYNF